MQMAVLLELLFHVPMRAKNAASLDLAKHFQLPVGRQARQVAHQHREGRGQERQGDRRRTQRRDQRPLRAVRFGLPAEALQGPVDRYVRQPERPAEVSVRARRKQFRKFIGRELGPDRQHSPDAASGGLRLSRRQSRRLRGRYGSFLGTSRSRQRSTSTPAQRTRQRSGVSTSSSIVCATWFWATKPANPWFWTSSSALTTRRFVPLDLTLWPPLDRKMWIAAKMPDDPFEKPGVGLRMESRHPAPDRAGLRTVSRLAQGARRTRSPRRGRSTALTRLA